MSVPTRDKLLVPFITNFNTLIGAGFASYGLTSAQSLQLDTATDTYLASASAVTVARSNGTISKTLRTTREAAKEALLPIARECYGVIQNLVTVSDTLKVGLGITLKPSSRSPVTVPPLAPKVEIVSVFGRQIRVRIMDAASGRRRKAKNAVGASLFSFIGATPPEGTTGWQAEGNVTKDEILVNVSESIAPNTKIYFTAFWYTLAGLSSVACSPVFTFTGHEGAVPLAS